VRRASPLGPLRRIAKAVDLVDGFELDMEPTSGLEPLTCSYREPLEGEE
jgi:hypothetical protein